MSFKAQNLAYSEELVDLNEASVNQLQSLLPGIGNVLATRIVAYRDENGPFESTQDLAKVSGIGERLISKLGPRLSVAPSMAPTSGYSVMSQPPKRISLAAEAGAEAAFFGVTGESAYPREKRVSLRTNEEALRSPGAPDLEALLRRGSPPEDDSEITLESPVLRATQLEGDTLAEVIPLQRSWRMWLIAAGVALMSATVGSIYGIRSQDGGPRRVLEHHLVRTIDRVSSLQGSVKNLEQQSEAFASSINALDARLSEQERNARGKPGKRVVPPGPTEVRSAPARGAPVEERAVEARPSSERTGAAPEVRANVRQALRALDPYVAQQPRMDVPPADGIDQ